MKDIPALVVAVAGSTTSSTPPKTGPTSDSVSSNITKPKQENNEEEEEDEFQDAIDFEGQDDGTKESQEDEISRLIASLKHESSNSATPETTDSSDIIEEPTRRRTLSSLLKRNQSQTSTPTMSVSKKEIAQLRAEATDENLLQDILEVEFALELFLNSQFKESEALLLPKYGKTLYFTEGVALFRSLRALMTFDPDDMSTAIESLGYASEVANSLRKVDKGSGGLFGMISGAVTTAANVVTGSKDPNYLNGMTRVEKHAELVYAECCCIQSLLTLISNTNLVNFVKEGMQMRNVFAVIRACFKFLEKIYDEEGTEGYAAHNLDEHFTSGVMMTAGIFTLVLSFLPSKIIKVFELMGFEGDRDVALDRLSTSAGWPFTPSIFVTGNPKSKFKQCFPPPPFKTGTSGGLRKSLSEIVLFAYHIILGSLNPLPDCNLPLASEYLQKCITRRENSFIYRAFRARMLETQARPMEAELEYNIVISLQQDYKQLYHACLWDMGLCRMAQQKWSSAHDGYAILYNESKWTKAVYRYLQAVTLYAQSPQDPRVVEMMKEVPTLLRRIAGYSIPIEKFLARKAKKFIKQGNRLLFPAYEILYFFHGLVMMSKETLLDVVSETTRTLKELSEARAKCPEGQIPYSTYHDDVCLALFIRAVAERELGYPSVNTLCEIKTQVTMGRAYNSLLYNGAFSGDPSVVPSSQQVSWLKDSIESFKKLFSETQYVELDHWMLLYGRYELGSLYLRVGQYDLAKKEFDASQNKGVSEGDGPEIRAVKKASLETMLSMRCHNAGLKLKALVETSKSFT